MHKPIRIIFCIPGKSFSNNFLVSWTQTIVMCMKNNIIPTIVSRTDSNVYYVRNKCLCGDVLRGKRQPIFNEMDYDYVMWIDSDQVFTFTDLASLIEHDLDVVGGIYLMDPGKLYAVVKDWDKNFYKKNGYFEFLSNDDVSTSKKKGETLLQVSYSGMGFMLIKKGVIEVIDYPWFSPIWEEFGEEGTSEADLISEFTSEDVGFCRKLIKAGIKIHVDLNVVVGHEKMTILI